MKLQEKLPEAFKGLVDEPVAIWGAGASGMAISKLLEKSGIEYQIYDQVAGVEDDIFHAFGDLEAQQHKLIIYSLAFDKSHPWFKLAKQWECEAVSELEFANSFRQGRSLVVMGTNGKSTLAEFMAFSIKRIGRHGVVVGKNHYPLSRLAIHPDQDGIEAICEIGHEAVGRMQNFPCEAIFWVNFHEDHFDNQLERMHLFQGYCHLIEITDCKKVYVGPSIKAVADSYEIELPKKVNLCPLQSFDKWELSSDSVFEKPIHWETLSLYLQYWKDEGLAESSLRKAADNFNVRSFRLYPVAQIGKVSFWNDAKAANYAATKSAIFSFPEPVIWIGGGCYRGGDLDAFFDEVEKNVKIVVFTGEDAPKFAINWRKRAPECYIKESIRDAVEYAYELAEGETTVVFSPGFVGGRVMGDINASGLQFENAVLGLKHGRETKPES